MKKIDAHHIATLSENTSLAKEWHGEKNGALVPALFAPHSHKKVWWKCSRGHEWQATIASRSHGSNCPFCSGRYPTIDNCLAVVNPELAGEWHPDRNKSLTPYAVTPCSNKRAWWKCLYGHEWEAIINNRSHGSKCPYCSGKIATPENCLAFLLPSVAQEWHPTKNRDLTPKNVTPSSGLKVWWKCPYGHEWQATVANRNIGSGCPYCANQAVNEDNCLKSTNPALAREWHPGRNKTLTPLNVTAVSHKRVWWRCSRGHEWHAPIYRRNLGSGCPHCSRKTPTSESCLMARNPALCAQWHPSRNTMLTPKDVTPSSRKKAWWICTRNHEWQDTVLNRHHGAPCPVCLSISRKQELRIYAEMKYIFRNVIHQGKINGLECAIIIPHLKVGIEVVTANRQLQHHDHYVKKAHFFNSRDILYIRVAESEGNSENNLVLTGESVDFDVIKQLITLIGSARTVGDTTEKLITQYIQEGVFKNESELSALLGSE